MKVWIQALPKQSPSLRSSAQNQFGQKYLLLLLVFL